MSVCTICIQIPFSIPITSEHSQLVVPRENLALHDWIRSDFTVEGAAHNNQPECHVAYISFRHVPRKGQNPLVRPVVPIKQKRSFVHYKCTYFCSYLPCYPHPLEKKRIIVKINTALISSNSASRAYWSQRYVDPTQHNLNFSPPMYTVSQANEMYGLESRKYECNTSKRISLSLVGATHVAPILNKFTILPS